LTTALLTLARAMILFLFSELLQLRGQMGTIVDRVISYATDLTSGTQITRDREKEIRQHLRSGATQLSAKAQMIAGYRLWASFHLIPGDSNQKAEQALMGLSNS
jgi:hypothetical protein